MVNGVYPKFVLAIPYELDVKLKHAYADRKLHSTMVAGQMRWILKTLVQMQNITLTKGYDDGMKRALMLTDEQGIAALKTLLLWKETNTVRAAAGDTTVADPVQEPVLDAQS